MNKRKHTTCISSEDLSILERFGGGNHNRGFRLLADMIQELHPSGLKPYKKPPAHYNRLHMYCSDNLIQVLKARGSGRISRGLHGFIEDLIINNDFDSRQ